MKKIISMFALVGLFAFAVPTVASACEAVQWYCGSEPAGIVVVCSQQDMIDWAEILCCEL